MIGNIRQFQCINYLGNLHTVILAVAIKDQNACKIFPKVGTAFIFDSNDPGKKTAKKKKKKIKRIQKGGRCGEESDKVSVHKIAQRLRNHETTRSNNIFGTDYGWLNLDICVKCFLSFFFLFALVCSLQKKKKKLKMHAGVGPVRNMNTTSSMIIELTKDNKINIYTTCVANPCVAIFRPLWFDIKVNDCTFLTKHNDSWLINTLRNDDTCAKV